MKKIILSTILLTLLAFSDCNLFEPENFPPDPDIKHLKTIVNNSSHTLEIRRIWKGEIRSPYILFPTDKKEFLNEIYKENIPFFSTLGDSTVVIYDNDISVLHTKQEIQDVSRSIMLESSYTGGKVNDKLYEIYYTFTDEDYEEAVALNGGG